MVVRKRQRRGESEDIEKGIWRKTEIGKKMERG